MYQFDYDYRMGNHSEIAVRLDITIDQLEPLHQYTDFLATINEETAYGTAAAKTIESGLA